ncbi:Vacuolar protein sorting-associated protein 52 [Coemansia spiralis]|uniref:Vacuolar protein sorting-associated protein 52 n=2 Tax=Coemansia TaxID=4863 RepID=A0A9W8GCJ7_9FUNG|nr:Vacuolar protein sorting-associated protein 52 [Coemansia umbellata]KAJ2624674.1 Vacuolar protein sorting-associated protein 52 [Coemansia sp. RSA 1358]KAJ2679740.1 Vacuolar protein sorting-associated protein 52 [Coemansia spiralis]
MARKARIPPNNEQNDVDIVFEGFDTTADEPTEQRRGEQEEQLLPDIENDELVKRIVTKGVDMRQYAREIEQELQELEESQLSSYEENESALLELDSEIKGCDEVLENMERLLVNFKSSLGNINNDIQALQSDSLSMSIRLKNRIVTEKQLGRIIQGIVVSPESVRTICDGEVNEKYLECLIEVNKKIAYLRVHNRQHRKLKAFQEMQPELERLCLKASSKIREFLLEKINDLRSLNTNAHILQNSVLLKYRFFNHFLIERHPEAAVEVRDTYIHIMRQYYLDHFETYQRGLMKLERAVADRTDVIGMEESNKISLFGSTKPTARDKNNVFNLGARASVLDIDDDPRAIVLSIAGDTNEKYPFEALFRSYNLALADNATAEYEFIMQFFVSPKARQKITGSDMARMVFGHIYEPSIHVGEQFLKAYLENTHDALGVLLCIRIVSQIAAELQRRLVPVLESYVNLSNMQLWPRFQAILDSHIESIKRLASYRAKAKIDTQPPATVRRYAELAASLLRLNHGYNTHVVALSLARLRAEVQAYITHIANGSSDKHASHVFLVNSYDLTLTVLYENGFTEREEEVSNWKQELTGTVVEFAELELEKHFGYLKQFVVNAEQQSDIGQIGTETINEAVRTFNAEWRNQIAAINSSIIQSFSNFRTGTEILHAVLGQLIIYYTRFHSLYDKRFARRNGSGGGAMSQPVGVQNVMVEIKKYRSNF